MHVVERRNLAEVEPRKYIFKLPTKLKLRPSITSAAF